MFWKVASFVAMLAQLPYLVSGLLIGPGGPLKISWRTELFLARMSVWSRWLFVPAAVIVTYWMFKTSVPWWFVALDVALSVYLTFVFWHAGRDAVEEHEDLRVSGARGDVGDQ